MINSLFLLFNLLLVLVPKHDFHISKCLVEYSVPDQALQISLHVFVDDLEEALRKQGYDNLKIGTTKEDSLAETYLSEYLLKTFLVEIDDQPVTLSLLGKELSDDFLAVWCYLEATDISDFQKLKLSNTVLMEVFDDQTNMVTIKGPGGKRGGFLFQKGNEEGTVNF